MLSRMNGGSIKKLQIKVGRVVSFVVCRLWGSAGVDNKRHVHATSISRQSLHFCLSFATTWTKDCRTCRLAILMISINMEPAFHDQGLQEQPGEYMRRGGQEPRWARMNSLFSLQSVLQYNGSIFRALFSAIPPPRYVIRLPWSEGLLRSGNLRLGLASSPQSQNTPREKHDTTTRTSHAKEGPAFTEVIWSDRVI
jgi:hypothetical protein